MSSAEQRSPGRPRNPDIDRRILDAALDIYAQRGWSGLTMDEIARRAGIGKAALYLRWSSKEDLLGEAFAAGSPRFTPEDAELSPRELLLHIGIQMRQQYTARFGPALLRLALDAEQVPELYQRLSTRFYEELEFGIRALDASGAGESLPPETGSVALIEALSGAILMRTLFTARWNDPHGIEATDEFVRGVVDIIAAAPATEPGGEPTPTLSIPARRPGRGKNAKNAD